MDDLISRQAAIDALDEIEAEVADGFGFEYEKWRKYFCDLPPAQPDVPDINVGDMISRAKAIEALDKRFDSIPMEQTSEILMLRKDLRELPPAQPEPFQPWEVLAVQAVLSQPKMGKWIYHIDDLFPAESTKECDQCHAEQPLICDDEFCPHCGAKMTEGDAE